MSLSAGVQVQNMRLNLFSIVLMRYRLQDNTADGNDKKEKKKKQTVKSIELPIDGVTAGFNQAQINLFVEEECKMIAGK